MTRPRRRCAFLVMHEPGDFVTDYELAIEPLASLGWEVETVAWRGAIGDWNGFDAVYICTPWDYPDAPGEFLSLLRDIHESTAVLVNPLPLVEWNLDKRYLRDLEASGVRTVPSDWQEDFDAMSIASAFARFDCDKLVIKPVVGANAADTFVLSKHDQGAGLPLARCFARRAHVLQPFIGNITGDGEYSLFFLGGAYSHAIRKVPATGDFRVQEEHGAAITACTAEPSLLAAAQRAMAAVSPAPCYARADFVRADRGDWLLMELELIEPSLCLRMNPAAPLRFANALDAFARAAAP